jgi:putative peptidoglycan lipid II flippase
VNVKKNTSIVRAAGLIGFFTLLSRLVGLYRDRLFASHFGAGDILDSYYAAFRIPDLVFNLLILGTLSVAFIPVFTEYFHKDPEEANKISNTVLNASFLGMACIVLLLLFFVPEIAKLVAPGFTGKKLSETIILTRIFLFSPVIFTVSSVFSSVLNSLKRFLIVSIAPIIYNFGIIFGIIFLYPHFGIRGLAYGVILGALAHLIIQAAAVFYQRGQSRRHFVYHLEMDLKHAGVRKILRLFVPRIFGIDNSQFSLLIGSIIGSVLASGSIAVFNLANNLQAVPIGIFAISFAVASFPNLSESFAKKDDKEFNHIFVKTAINILFFALPISVLMLLLRAQIIRVILGSGNFDWQATKLTANTLGIFAFSIFAQSLIPLVARAFYARHNTKTPVIIGLVSMAFNLILSYILSRHYGVLGVVAGFSIASVFNFLALYMLLRRQLQHLDDNYLLYAVLKIIFASLLMAIVIYIALYYLGLYFVLDTGWHVFIQGFLAGIIGIAMFLLFSFLLDMEQTRFVFKFLKEKVWNKMLFRDTITDTNSNGPAGS